MALRWVKQIALSGAAILLAIGTARACDCHDRQSYDTGYARSAGNDECRFIDGYGRAHYTCAGNGYAANEQYADGAYEEAYAPDEDGYDNGVGYGTYDGNYAAGYGGAYSVAIDLNGGFADRRFFRDRFVRDRFLRERFPADRFFHRDFIHNRDFRHHGLFDSTHLHFVRLDRFHHGFGHHWSMNGRWHNGVGSWHGNATFFHGGGHMGMGGFGGFGHH